VIVANVGSGIYNVFLLLHILAVIVAFAPGFVWPMLTSGLRRAGKSLGPEANQVAADYTLKFQGPAAVLAGVFGLGLIGLSDSAWEFSQTWISLAFVLWFVLLGVVFGLLLPTYRKVAGGDTAAEQRAAMFHGMLHLVLALMLIDMIWKPGA
jgi:uncharacterized membrane protein